jgi:hypothetical protein
MDFNRASEFQGALISSNTAFILLILGDNELWQPTKIIGSNETLKRL